MYGRLCLLCGLLLRRSQHALAHVLACEVKGKGGGAGKGFTEAKDGGVRRKTGPMLMHPRCTNRSHNVGQ